MRALAAGDVAACPLLEADYAAKLATARGKRILAALAPLKGTPALAFLESEPSDSDHILRYRAQANGNSFVVASVATKELKIYAVATREWGSDS